MPSKGASERVMMRASKLWPFTSDALLGARRGECVPLMGEYRDQREARTRRYDDDPVSERTPEPSYLERPSLVAKDPVDAKVISFNASKGFGFKLSDGREAYLHARVLEAAVTR